MLNDQQICEVVRQYLNSNIYNYAIMIDGKWGCGKTHFVSKTLIPEIEKEKKKVIYMSLYGIENVSSLSETLCLKTLGKLEKIATLARVGTPIIAPLVKLTGGLGSALLDVAKNSGKKILDNLAQFNDCVVIFDDLERCSCNINETLGFINNLVEHSGVKTIIVANQEELPKVGNNQEYERIKEKVIGTTILYEPNLEQIMKRLTADHIKNKCLKKIILDELPQMELDVENKNGSKDKDEKNDSGISNIRTFQFFLEKIKALNLVIKKSCQAKHLPVILKDVVSHCFATCYAHKRGCNDNESAQSELWLPNRMFRKSFVDDFVRNCDKNENKITESIKNYEKILDDQNDPRRKLADWQFDSDENVLRDLAELKKKICERKYRMSEYSMILSLVMDILERVALYDNNEREIKKIVDDMCANIGDESNSETFETSGADVYLDDISEERKRKFSSYGEKLFKALKNKKNSSVKNTINSCLEDEANWGRLIDQFCFDKKSTDLLAASIFQNIDISRIISLVEKSTNENILQFKRYLHNLYGFTNISEYFKDDAPKLKELSDGIRDLLDHSKFDKIKTLAVNSLLQSIEGKHKILTAAGGVDNE